MTWDEGLEPSLAQEVDMTLILAAHAKDGVVVAGDDKMTSLIGKPPRFRKKVFKLHDGTVVGMARSVDNGEILLRRNGLFTSGPDTPYEIAHLVARYIAGLPKPGIGPIDFAFMKPGHPLVLIETKGQFSNYQTYPPVEYKEDAAYLGHGPSGTAAWERLKTISTRTLTCAELKKKLTAIIQQVSQSYQEVGNGVFVELMKGKNDPS